MLRAIFALGNVLKCSQNSPGIVKVFNTQGIRNSHKVSYRVAPTNPKITTVCAEIVGATMWWWVIWHLWHEYEHITGEFPYPSTSAWTNDELGIPASN